MRMEAPGLEWAIFAVGATTDISLTSSPLTEVRTRFLSRYLANSNGRSCGRLLHEKGWEGGRIGENRGEVDSLWPRSCVIRRQRRYRLDLWAIERNGVSERHASQEATSLDPAWNKNTIYGTPKPAPHSLSRLQNWHLQTFSLVYSHFDMICSWWWVKNTRISLRTKYCKKKKMMTSELLSSNRARRREFFQLPCPPSPICVASRFSKSGTPWSTTFNRYSLPADHAWVEQSSLRFGKLGKEFIGSCPFLFFME